MKKPLNLFLQVFGISWILFIAVKYFLYHPEYFGSPGLASAFSTTTNLWNFLLLFTFGYLGWVVYQSTFAEKENLAFKKLTAFKILGFFTLFLFLFADFWFLSTGLSKENSFWTAQISLISKLGSVYLFLFALTLITFSAGKKILNFFKIQFENKLADTMISIGTGLGIVMLINFLLGVFGQINPLSLGIAFILILIFCFQETKKFLRLFFLEEIDFQARFFSFQTFFLFSLGFVLILNTIDLIRPMPIGWDDMGVYLNQPKLIAGNQELLAGVTNNYFLIASLPFVFIQNEYFAAMHGMFISFWGGVLMLFALMAFVSRFFKQKYALMTAALIYIIPMTMHQSYADMKTDMTLFFFMILSVYLFFKWFTQKTNQGNFKRYLILSGIFAGIAFGIKPTAILLIFGILIGIAYRIWSWQGALGIYLLEWIILKHSGHLLFLKAFSPQVALIATIILAILALLFFVLGHKKHQKTKSFFLSLIIFLFATGIVFSPWAIKNIAENNYKINLGTILNGRDYIKPNLDFKAINVDVSQCDRTAHSEELDRYLGYDQGVMRYLSLPWKVTMNTTVHGFYLDLSFLFLSFAPLGLIVLWIRRKEEENQTANWIPLLLMGTGAWIMWLFVGNGVIWYGIFGFILILPLTAYFFFENKTPSLKITTGIMVILSILSVIALRGTKFGNPVTSQYTFGISSGQEVIDTVVPNYRQIVCIVTGGTWNDKYRECKNSGKKETSPIYRVGTFIAYFIPENNKRLFNDPQLDTFKCVDDASLNSDLLTMQKFEKAGYKYFIFDLNTATIEKDPNGSLHQKANRFVEWVNNLGQTKQIYVHAYNPQKGIAFLEITSDNPIEE